VNDPFNPTESELVDWAYDPEAVVPCQDWEVMVTDLDRGELFLRLCADPECPNRIFFLRCLYLLVGDAVRFCADPRELEPLRRLFERAAQLEEPRLKRWVDRSLDLIAHPDTFDYPRWCEGRWAEEEWP
jgi:hypothetical protein